MHTAVFKVGAEQLHGLFKVSIIFDKRFVEGNVRNRRTASDPVLVSFCDGVKECGKALSVISAVRLLSPRSNGQILYRLSII